MKLLKFLLASSRSNLLLIMLAGVLGGVFSTGLIALVNRALNEPEAATGGFVILFVVIIVSRSAVNAVAQLLIVRFSQRLVADLRVNLSRKILLAPLRRIESSGSAVLMGILIQDIQAITAGLVILPGIAVNASIIVGCSAYLAWLSWQTFLMLGVVFVVGIGGYRLLVRHAYNVFKRVRNDEDRLFGHFRALIDGAKELKLHARRRQTLYEAHLQPTIESARHFSVSASTSFIIANNWVQLLFYGLIALILFVLPRVMTTDPYVITGYVLGVLYLIRPLEVTMDAMAGLARTMAALEKTEEIEVSLDALASDTAEDFIERKATTPIKLEFRGLEYTYKNNNKDDSFHLGPIDLTVEPGELLFVTGGNGSGKSTLAKLITGLYAADGGQILLADEVVDDANRDNYRQHFTAVFSDFYLFDSLLGLESPDLEAKAAEYLERLCLQESVKIENGTFSTTALSRGQRKRLALLTAFLEDRPVYVFDEWAADQDPEFRQLFYERLLPETKARNKSVIVISHDDRFYHIADRVIRLDYGRVVEVKANRAAAP